MQVKKHTYIFIFITGFFFFHKSASAQTDTSHVEGTDVFDLLGDFSKHFDVHHQDSVPKRVGKYHFPVLPVIGYTLATGFVGGLAGSLAFYTSEGDKANISNILAQLVYTQKNQTIFTIQPNIWTNENRYLFKADYAYLKYPAQTFGLGNRSTINDISYIDYSHIRIYQTALKQVLPDFFTGIGYALDYHWNIKQTGNSGQDIGFSAYGYAPQSSSSGITFNFLFDNRRSSINPQKGFYINTVYRQNYTFLGSDQNWQSLVIDARKYFKLPGRSKNILAFWSYNNLTLTGKPPYLDLPGTGLDEYNNTGRGYIQGRFRGKNMTDLESEYRYAITRNGLLGGVVFANAQSFAKSPGDILSNKNIIPGGGFGLRIKIHKHTDTNLCVDYGFGTEGSNGLFLNLNEAF